MEHYSRYNYDIVRSCVSVLCLCWVCSCLVSFVERPDSSGCRAVCRDPGGRLHLLMYYGREYPAAPHPDAPPQRYLTTRHIDIRPNSRGRRRRSCRAPTLMARVV